MAKGAPFVAVRTDVRKDERFAVLGDVCGYNRHEALGRMMDLWAWCVDRRLADAPADCKGYAISESVACRFLGRNGVRGLLGDGVDEFALAELRDDGLLYLRGTEETVSRQRGLRITAVAGGIACAENATRDRGRFVSKTAIDQPSTSREPAVSPAGHQPEPARSQNQIPDPTGQNPDALAPRARAIPPSTTPSTTPAPAVGTVPYQEVTQEVADRAVVLGMVASDRCTLARRNLVSDSWRFAGEQFRALQAEGIDLDATAAPWAGLPAASSQPMVELRARIDELLIGDEPDFAMAAETIQRAVLVGVAKARKSGSLEYLTPARLWDRRSFAIDSALTPKQVARGARDGPARSARSSRAERPTVLGDLLDDIARREAAGET